MKIHSRLIADCGSTKCVWATTHDGKRYTTRGFNPAVMQPCQISEILSELSLPLEIDIQDVHFYGAGCIGGDVNQRLDTALRECLPLHATIPVAIESDIVGASRALFGDRPGLVCILGTGQACVLWDGHRITGRVPSLGYILGDEGSGASLGKRLVTAVYRHQLPQPLIDRFLSLYPFTEAEIIDRVYRQPAANRFLASFAPFLSQNIEEGPMLQMVEEEYARFVNNNLHPLYQQSAKDNINLPIGIVGSVGYAFRNIITTMVTMEYNLPEPSYLAAPIDNLLAYHTTSTK